MYANHLQAAFLAGALAGPCLACDIIVPDSGYLTIQDAIDHSSSGDVICIRAGTWTGTGNKNLIFHDWDLKIRSYDNDATTCTIDCGGTGRGFHIDVGPDYDIEIENLTITNGDVVGTGGAMYVEDDSEPFIFGCRFIGNVASVNGGAVAALDNSYPFFASCDFEDNFTIGAGGGAYCSYTNAAFWDCTFSGNSANGGGGAIRATSIANVHLTECTFDDNSSVADGGALFIDNWSYPVVDTTTFSGNGADGDGGAIVVDDATCHPAFTDCTFSFNRSEAAGGACCIRGADVSFTNVVFVANTSGSRGGAIRNESGAAALFHGCSFLGCSAGSFWGGGAVFTSDSLANFSNCDFDGNSAGARGGALRYRDEATGVITGGTFTGNDAQTDGGAIAVTDGAEISVSDVDFTSNTAGNRGGAVFNSGRTDTTFSECDFTFNQASSLGGALCNSYATPTISECTFTENMTTAVGGAGGAVANITQAEATLNKCFFRRNECIASGGGIENLGSRCTITWSLFEENYTMGQGGGIACHADQSIPETIVQYCRFYDNFANDYGGGIANVDYGDLWLYNSLFRGNESGGHGGGVYNTDAAQPPWMEAINCTFSRNSASSEGGGIHSDDAAYVDLANSIFWENDDSTGMTEAAQLYLGTAYDVNYCCVQDWTGGFGGTGNHGDDPHFVNPAAGDLHLTSASMHVCIETGDNASVPGSIDLDLDCYPRFRDADSDGTATVDMGVYEYHECPGDFDADGSVGTSDLLFLLGCWGSVCGDLDADGDTDTGDLLALLAAWGPCP